MTEQEALEEAKRLIAQDVRRKFISHQESEVAELSTRMDAARFSMEVDALAGLVKLHAEAKAKQDGLIREFDRAARTGERTWRGVVKIRSTYEPPAANPEYISTLRAPPPAVQAALPGVCGNCGRGHANAGCSPLWDRFRFWLFGKLFGRFLPFW